MQKQEFTFTIYAENVMGILNRITTMFSRRRVNIEALNVAASEVDGIHRFTIVVVEAEEVIKKLSLQIEKQVGVVKSFYNNNTEICWQEQAFYKIQNSTLKPLDTASFLQQTGARQISYNSEFIIYETTGSAEITKTMLKNLETHELVEFVRSARIAIIKAGNTIHENLQQFDVTYPT